MLGIATPNEIQKIINAELMPLAKALVTSPITPCRLMKASSERYMPQDDSAITFSVGQRVRHQMFGPGTVVEVDMERGAHVVQFDEVATPRRISFRAKLEKL